MPSAAAAPGGAAPMSMDSQNPAIRPASEGERVRAVLIDLGGVLETGCWPAIAEAWAPRLGITTGQLLAAVFGGSDAAVLTGRVSEDDWWQRVRRRLRISQAELAGVRAGITARWCWDEQLLACLGRVRGRARTAIVSNAWPHARVRLAADGVSALADAVVLSCEAGAAKTRSPHLRPGAGPAGHRARQRPVHRRHTRPCRRG
jgi:FMN phosphatase YigB (HAD superfamily)